MAQHSHNVTVFAVLQINFHIMRLARYTEAYWDSIDKQSIQSKVSISNFFCYTGENAAWDEFVRRSIPHWQSHAIAWLVNSSSHPVLMVRFEDLKTDLLGQTKRMLQFLGVPFSENQLQQKLSQDFGTFHRRHHEDFDHFTSEQRELVLGIVRETVDVLRHSNSGSTFRIEEYLSWYLHHTSGLWLGSLYWAYLLTCIHYII